MSQKTLLTMTEAAEMVGLTRPTFYRKIEELGISLVEEKGKKRVDVSELIRVFGTDVKLNADKASNVSKKPSTDKKPDYDADETLNVKLAVLESELKREKQFSEEIKDQVEYLKDQIALEKAEKNQMTLLLEDQREKEKKGDAWERNFKALEKRISNQENAAKEYKEERQKILRQNQALKKALEEEKSKTIWQKLFG